MWTCLRFPSWMSTLWTTALLLGTSLTPVASESRGAPTCDTGSAVGQPHLSAGYTQLLIDEFSFIEIVVDSPRFGPQTVRRGRTMYVPVNQTITVTVSKSDRPFKGIMTRIEGGSANADVGAAFSLNDGELDLKDNELCDPDVAGITHTSASPKNSLSWTMFFDTPSSDMKWDVNIVEQRVPSRFFYSNFNVTALADDETRPPTPPPTETPTSSPTATPASSAVALSATSIAAATLAILLAALVS